MHKSVCLLPRKKPIFFSQRYLHFRMVNTKTNFMNFVYLLSWLLFKFYISFPLPVISTLTDISFSFFIQIDLT